MIKDAVGEENNGYALTSCALGVLHTWRREFETAKPLLLRAAEIQVKGLGEKHLDYVNTITNLADLYIETGDYDRDAPWLGRLETARGRYEQAEPLLTRSLAIREKVLTADHTNIADSLESYAVLLRKMKRDNEAEAVEARAGAIRAKISGGQTRAGSDEYLTSA